MTPKKNCFIYDHCKIIKCQFECFLSKCTVFWSDHWLFSLLKAIFSIFRIPVSVKTWFWLLLKPGFTVFIVPTWEISLIQPYFDVYVKCRFHTWHMLEVEFVWTPFPTLTLPLLLNLYFLLQSLIPQHFSLY